MGRSECVIKGGIFMNENKIYDTQKAERIKDEKELSNQKLKENFDKMKFLKRVRNLLFVFEAGYVVFYLTLIVAAVMTVKLFDIFDHVLFMAPVVAMSFLGTTYKKEPEFLLKLLIPCVFIGVVSIFIAKGLMIAFLISAILDWLYYRLALDEIALSEEPGYPYFVEGLEERSHQREYIPENNMESYRRINNMEQVDFQNFSGNPWMEKERKSENVEMESVSL